MRERARGLNRLLTARERAPQRSSRRPRAHPTPHCLPGQGPCGLLSGRRADATRGAPTGEAYGTIGEIQRQAHNTWKAPAADTLSALRSALDLDGELTEQQRETYFALLEPHEDTD